MLPGATCSEIELGNLDPKRDYVNVSDVVSAITTIINSYKGRFDVFNIGSGKEYSVCEILELIEKIIGRKVGIMQRKDRIRTSDRMHLLANIDHITNELGWNPHVDIETGLKDIFL